MASNKMYDVVIFGSTGFTGKCVVQEFINLNDSNLKWAIAGRDRQKLRDVLNWACLKTGKDVSATPIIIADVVNIQSIIQMTKVARVLINCVGPYAQFGEPVVKACIDNGTHHLDISGEPSFLDSMCVKYHDLAESNNVYVIGACGFDSVLADFGVYHMSKNFPGTLNAVESYFAAYYKSMNVSVNIGTWASIVYGVSTHNTALMKQLRNQMFSTLNNLDLKPSLNSKSLIHCSELFHHKLSIPFPGADRSVVLRSQQLLYETNKQRPIQYRPYLICSLPLLLAIMVIAVVVGILSKFSCGRKLLLKYPRFFSLGIMSNKGPTEEVRAESLAKFRFKGYGWSHDIANKYDDQLQIRETTNTTMVTELSISNFGYRFTARVIILGAFTILREHSKIPLRGGVLSPIGAFSNTSFVDKISNTELSVKFLSPK